MHAELARLLQELASGHDVIDCARRFADAAKDLPAREREQAVERFRDIAAELI